MATIEASIGDVKVCTIDASARVAIPGASLTLVWSGNVGAEAADYVQLFRAGASDADGIGQIKNTNVDVIPTGSMPVVIPFGLPSGGYEYRLFRTGKGAAPAMRLANTPNIMVTGSAGAAIYGTINILSASGYTPGSTLYFAWAIQENPVADPVPTRIVALRARQQNPVYDGYVGVSGYGGQGELVIPTGGTFTPNPGIYELALFLGTLAGAVLSGPQASPTNYLIATSDPFGLSLALPTITLSRSGDLIAAVALGTRQDVRFQSANPHAQDQIAMIRTSDNVVIDRQGTGGVTAGVLYFMIDSTRYQAGQDYAPRFIHGATGVAAYYGPAFRVA